MFFTFFPRYFFTGFVHWGTSKTFQYSDSRPRATLCDPDDSLLTHKTICTACHPTYFPQAVSFYFLPTLPLHLSFCALLSIYPPPFFPPSQRIFSHISSVLRFFCLSLVFCRPSFWESLVVFPFWPLSFLIPNLFCNILWDLPNLSGCGMMLSVLSLPVSLPLFSSWSWFWPPLLFDFPWTTTSSLGRSHPFTFSHDLISAPIPFQF